MVAFLAVGIKYRFFTVPATLLHCLELIFNSLPYCFSKINFNCQIYSENDNTSLVYWFVDLEFQKLVLNKILEILSQVGISDVNSLMKVRPVVLLRSVPRCKLLMGVLHAVILASWSLITNLGATKSTVQMSYNSGS